MSLSLKSDTAKGALFGLLAFGMFASHDVVIKLLGGGYSIFQIIFFSTIFSFPLLILMMVFDRSTATLRPNFPGWIAVRCGLSIPVMTCIFYAFTVLDLAETYAILFTTPLFITGLSVPFLKEQVGPRRWAAVLLGFVGVLIVLRPGVSDLGLGHLSALLGAFGAAVTFTILRKVGNAERASVMMLYPMLVNLAGMSLVLPFVYKPMAMPDLGINALMSVLGFLAAVTLLVAYRKAAAVIVAPTQYSQILWAVLYGTLFFGETLALNVALGAAIIIGSGIFIVFRESRIA